MRKLLMNKLKDWKRKALKKFRLLIIVLIIYNRRRLIHNQELRVWDCVSQMFEY
jgi:hypothetical protein